MFFKACRTLLCFLATALLLSFAAAEKQPMKVMGLGTESSFWTAHPEIPHQSVFYVSFADSLSEMLRTKPDVMSLSPNNEDVQAYIDADVLADLSGSQRIVQAVSRMAPAIRQMVTDCEGRILAMPITAYVHPFDWYQDAWDEACLTKADVPQSFTELLDFLDAWVERIRQKPEKNVCVSHLLRWNTGTEKYNYTYWLTAFLLHAHEMQQRHAGETVTFQTEAFISLAERARTTGLALYEAEPRQAKRQRMLQLFQSDLNGGEHANNGRAYGLSHSVPLRLTSDQPALTRLSMELGAVRKGTPWLEEALLLLEQKLDEHPWFGDYALYADFAAGDYAYDSGRIIHIDEGWLADYRCYTGELVAYPTSFNLLRDGLPEKEALMMQFFQKEISAEAFARGLDRIIQ